MQEQVGGPHEHDLTVHDWSLCVDQRLDSEQERRIALHLVDDHRRPASQERAPIGFDLEQRPRIIQSEIGTIGGRRMDLDKCALTGLPRSGDHHHSRGLERSREQATQRSGQEIIRRDHGANVRRSCG